MQLQNEAIKYDNYRKHCIATVSLESLSKQKYISDVTTEASMANTIKCKISAGDLKFNFLILFSHH